MALERSAIGWQQAISRALGCRPGEMTYQLEECVEKIEGLRIATPDGEKVSGRVKAVFLGPHGQRFTVDLPRTPPTLLVGKRTYRRVDDPDDGQFLGCYVHDSEAK